MEDEDSEIVVGILLDDEHLNSSIHLNESNDSSTLVSLHSLHQLSMWNISTLKMSCTKYGLNASNHTKDELIALAYLAQVMNLPEVPTAVQNILPTQKEYKKLLTLQDSTVFLDPLAEINDKLWLNEKEGISNRPKIGFNDIERYFIKQDMSAKKRKGYKYYASNWLSQVWMFIQKNFTYLKAQCIPSQKITSPPHKLWIMFEKFTSIIMKSYCTCTAK